MSESFNSTLIQSLNLTKIKRAEIKIIIKYIEKIIKHKISFLRNNRYESTLNTADTLLALAFFTNVTDIITKYSPIDFNLSVDTQWSELLMNIKLADEQFQQSQHLSDITEMHAIEYFTNLIEKIQNSIGKNKFTFRFNSSCDIFNLSHEQSKIDIIYDIYKGNELSEIAIECKYLSYAFFSDLIVKNLFNNDNKELNFINQKLSDNFKLLFNHCEAFKNYDSNITKHNLDNNFQEALDIINNHPEHFLPYVKDSINKVISFNVNKKNKQMKLFKETAKNILFISLCDLISKHNSFQGVLDTYYEKNIEDIPNIKIKVVEEKFHNIQWITLCYRYEGVKYKHYELIALNKDENGFYYEYQLRKTSVFNSFLLI